MLAVKLSTHLSDFLIRADIKSGVRKNCVEERRFRVYQTVTNNIHLLNIDVRWADALTFQQCVAYYLGIT